MSTAAAAFERTEYVEGRFKEQSFARGVYSGLRFEECRFESCDLSDCTLEDCKLVDTEFINCNLSLLQVRDTAFRGVKFTDCKLVGINWTRAHWQRVRMSAQLEFERCILNDSSFAGLHLPQIRMVECRICDADFSGTDCEQADFSHSDFTHSTFHHTNLKGADFREARNYSIDITRNDVSRAKFTLPEATALLRGLDIELYD